MIPVAQSSVLTSPPGTAQKGPRPTPGVSGSGRLVRLHVRTEWNTQPLRDERTADRLAARRGNEVAAQTGVCPADIIARG